ncbi:glucan 1:3-beta-glucosidase I/II [Diplocarpon mali]|nr:glucan 1:3-beta-glucosidase I/II [Diplocarpon mali]
MWNSLLLALIAILDLPGSASAITSAPENIYTPASAAMIFITYTVEPIPLKATPAIIPNTFTAVPFPAPAVLSATVTASPASPSSLFSSAGEASSIATFPTFSLGTGAAAGISFSGHRGNSHVGSGTRASVPRPSDTPAAHNVTSNRTRLQPARPRPVGVTSSRTTPLFTFPEPTDTATPTAMFSLASTLSTFLAITSSTSSSSQSVQAAPSPVPFLHGVNTGGWLILEKFMTPALFTGDFAEAKDQWEFDSVPGSLEALEKHWSTFITESDIQAIAAAGLNALRIPVGFWAYDNADTPYHSGADVYVERAIGWARKSGMKVLVDLHGLPGSQNGKDNSGKGGETDWQKPANLERSISVLRTMARKYGAMEYADVVVGLQLINEVISYGDNLLSVTEQWAQDAYRAVKAEVENQSLVVVMHDAFETAGSWTDIAKELNGESEVKTFGVDEHFYQIFTDTYNTFSQDQHVQAACSWASDLAAANKIMPTYVGEWTALTNVCVNPDGSTIAGTECTTEGCQCVSAPIEEWNEQVVGQVRRFIEAQLDVYEGSTSGHFMWSARATNGWDLMRLIEVGAMPNPITDRKYPGQCSGPSRDLQRCRPSSATFPNTLQPGSSRVGLVVHLVPQPRSGGGELRRPQGAPNHPGPRSGWPSGRGRRDGSACRGGKDGPRSPTQMPSSPRSAFSCRARAERAARIPPGPVGRSDPARRAVPCRAVPDEETGLAWEQAEVDTALKLGYPLSSHSSPCLGRAVGALLVP